MAEQNQSFITIRTYRTEQYEAVAYVRGDEWDEDRGEDMTHVVIHFNLIGVHAGGNATLTIGFAGDDRADLAIKAVGEIDAPRFAEMYANHVAPYYANEEQNPNE